MVDRALPVFERAIRDSAAGPREDDNVESR
jgi:hypothetical protein